MLDLSANKEAYGLPNHIQWRVDGLVEGVEYTVAIEGAVAGETPLATTCTFTLLQATDTVRRTFRLWWRV